VVLAVGHLAVGERGGRLGKDGAGGLCGGLGGVSFDAEHRTRDLGGERDLCAFKQLTELRLLDPRVGVAST